MRILTASVLVLALSGCPTTGAYTGPPINQLYYPTGIVHVDRPGNPHGLLFVANANFDKRFATGSVVGFDLNRIPGIPPFGAFDPDGGAPQLAALNIQAEAVVQVASFTGEMAGLETRDGGVRLYVPSRSEGNNFHAIDVAIGPDDQPALSCVLPPDAPANASLTDCPATAPSLTTFEFSESGLPRAPAPFGVSVRARRCAGADDCGAGRSCDNGTCRAANGDLFGDVWVTHITQADSPLASGKDLQAFAVRLDSDSLALTESNYVWLGPGATSSVVQGQRWAYLSGRYNSSTQSVNLMRLAEKRKVMDSSGNPVVVDAVVSAGLESTYRVGEARGVALSSDEKRLYLLGRAPDSLIVVNISDPTGDAPLLDVVRAVPLPEGSNQIRTIPRPGRSDLVAITCTGQGVVVLYDDDVGDLVAQVQGVGLQSFGLAVALRPPGARLFVTNFSDGRVALIDIPDLNRPQEARIAGYLGAQQLCLTRGATTPGCMSNEVAQ
ncbi:MAG: hypothetical protein AB1938_29955 [Myxococcota bacterium]